MREFFDWIEDIFTRTAINLDNEIEVWQIVVLIGILAIWLFAAELLRRWFRRISNRLKIKQNIESRIIAVLFLIIMIIGVGFAFRVSKINMGWFEQIFEYDLTTIFQSSEKTTITEPEGADTSEIVTDDNDPLTFARIFNAIAIILGVFILSKYSQWIIQTQVLQAFQIERHTQFIILRSFHFIMITGGVLISLRTIGLNFTSLAIIFGGLSIGIGFGLQNTVANLISGLILIFERPIKIGDLVEIMDVNIFGRVSSINLRSTVIMALEEKEIIVPNSKLVTEPVHNLTHYNNRYRIRIQVGVSYSSDVDLVKTVLLQAANEHDEVIKDPTPQMENVTPPFVRFIAFGESSLDFELFAWIPDSFRRFDVASDLLFMVWYKLKENNITIPFPQRDVHYYPDKSRNTD